MEFLVVGLMAMLATWAVRRKVRQRALPAPEAQELPRPVRSLIDELVRLDFEDCRKGAKRSRKRHEMGFTPIETSCKACAGRLCALLRVGRNDWVEYTVQFGVVCANCHLLKTTDAAEVPESIRDVWTRSSDFTDFLERMRHESGAGADEPLAERKARLERQLADLEARRDALRSELLTVKNRLEEPTGEGPHR